MIQVKVELTDSAAALLDRLVANGLHGDRRHCACAVLICRGLEDRAEELRRDIDMQPSTTVPALVAAEDDGPRG